MFVLFCRWVPALEYNMSSCHIDTWGHLWPHNSNVSPPPDVTIAISRRSLLRNFTLRGVDWVYIQQNVNTFKQIEMSERGINSLLCLLTWIWKFTHTMWCWQTCVCSFLYLLIHLISHITYFMSEIILLAAEENLVNMWELSGWLFLVLLVN